MLPVNQSNDDICIFVSYLTKTDKQLLHNEGLRLLQLADGNEGGLPEIAKGKNGKPFFKDRHAEFNISHSGKAAAVIYNEKKHDGRVLGTAIDIQKIDPKKNMTGIMHKAFCETEIAYISNAHNDKEKLMRFYQIWALKETAIKLNSLTVFDIKNIPSFVSDEGLLQIDCFDYLLCTVKSLDEEYMLAAARESCTKHAKPLQANIKYQ
jgi:phosphopantetheinyl transferase